MSNLIISGIFQAVAILFWVYFLFTLLVGGGDNLGFVSIIFLIAGSLQFLALWLKRKSGTTTIEPQIYNSKLTSKKPSYLISLIVICVILFLLLLIFFISNLHD